MYRVTKLSHAWYAKQISSVAQDEENIEVFANEGTPVIIVDSLEDLESIDIDPSEIEVVG